MAVSAATTAAVALNLCAHESQRVDTQQHRNVCVRCGASFSQPERLLQHLSFYCTQPATTTATAVAVSMAEKDSAIQPAIVSVPISLPAASAPSLLTAPKPNLTPSAAALADAISALIQQQQRPPLQPEMVAATRPSIPSNGIGASISSLSGSLASLTNAATNTIILPVARHRCADPALIQIVGPPQTIIPVAIGAQMPPVARPLLLDGALISQLDAPLPQKLPLNPEPHEFGLPLAFVQSWPPGGAATSTFAATTAPTLTTIPTATATVTASSALSPSVIGATGSTTATANGATKRIRSRNSSNSSSASKRKCDSTETHKPLDLSRQQPNGTSTITDTKSSNHQNDSESQQPDGKAAPTSVASTSAAKPFACECGIAFLSADTLNSHKKYYCRNRVVDESEELEQQRKVPSNCPHCDYVPATHAQLQQHIRHKHCLIQAFVCLLCGYKGYSARGIKNHLRNFHADEMAQRRRSDNPQCLSDKSLLNDYVCCITPDTKQQQCPKCRSTFPTDELIRRHVCSGERQPTPKPPPTVEKEKSASPTAVLKQEPVDNP